MYIALALRPGDARRWRFRPWRARLTIALIAGLSVLLAACGGSGGSSFTPRADSSSPGAQSGAVAFAQCVRSRGVPNFPDPQNGRFLLPGSLQSNPNFRPAVQACQHLLGPGGATNSGSGNSLLLAFAHCMQTHGVPNFPDPSANGGILGGSGINPNSPQFQQAYQECQSLLSGGQG
jgi:hypothetical protein